MKRRRQIKKEPLLSEFLQSEFLRIINPHQSSSSDRDWRKRYDEFMTWYNETFDTKVKTEYFIPKKK